MKSVLWGGWFLLYLCLMYENVVGIRAATFYGLCTYGWHRLGTDKNGIVYFAVEAAFVIPL